MRYYCIALLPSPTRTLSLTLIPALTLALNPVSPQTDTPNASCPGPRRCLLAPSVWSVCACPLTTDDTMHITDLFRRECPYDHTCTCMVCSTCALPAPHIFHVVGFHACVDVLCAMSDDPELPPETSLLPRTPDLLISAPTLSPSCLRGCISTPSSQLSLLHP